MYLLHLETSSKNCSVAVSRDSKLICSCEDRSGFKHNENLHSFIKYVIEGAEISINNLKGICLGKGPGSYTGLRIGTAAAKGLCYALDIPLVVINSLKILTQVYLRQSYEYIIPMIDARKMQVYTAIFSSDGKFITPTHKLIIDKNFLITLRNKKIVIIGDGALKAEKFISENFLIFKSIKFFPEKLPSAKDMVSIGFKLFEKNFFESIAYFEPIY